MPEIQVRDIITLGRLFSRMLTHPNTAYLSLNGPWKLSHDADPRPANLLIDGSWDLTDEEYVRIKRLVSKRSGGEA